MTARISSPLLTHLGNAVSDAIHAALVCGLEIDEAVCVVAQVAADYARGEYGDDYLDKLASVVRDRATMPLPGEA